MNLSTKFQTSILLGISFFCFFFSFSKAEFNIEIDEENIQVYLASGEEKITLDTLSSIVKQQKEEKSDSSLTNTTETETGATSTIQTGDQSDLSLSGVVQTGENLSGNNETGTIQNSDSLSGNQYIDTHIPNVCEYTGKVLVNLQTGTELEKAIYWMYNNGLTMYNTLSGYRPQDKVTREESAKLIGQLYNILGFEKKDKGRNCTFADAEKFNPTLKDHITNVCVWGIFQGSPITHEFMPYDELTKGQTLAVLIRILENKLSDETIQPRWLEYYVKAKIIGITNEKNLQKMEMGISREEIALLLYRYKDLIVKPDGCSNKENVVSRVSGNLTVAIQQVADSRSKDENNTGLIIDNIGTVDLGLLAGNTSLADNPEFKEAINWMYDQGITSFNTSDEYLPFETPTREQIAKMIDKFATAMNLTTIRNTDCSFTDIENSVFKESIVKVCQLGVMGGVGNEFNPLGTVKKSDFIALLIRLFEGKKLDENTDPWWLNYYQRAIDLSLISAQDTVTFDKEISRYEVAVFLYRLKVRLTMYNNLNDTIIPDEIIKTLEDTTGTGEKASANVSVDIAAINNQNFSEGFIELFGNRYKIKKLTTDTYNIGDNSFVWYGSVTDFVTGEKIGIINFIITNKNLTEGTVRLLKNNKSFQITKDELVNTYYYLKQI